MNQRSKILLLGVLMLLLVLRLHAFTADYLFGPIAEQELQIESLEEDLRLQQQVRRRIEKAVNDYEQDVTRSLPARTSIAATLYQNWLVQTCAEVGLKRVTVTPSTAEQVSDGAKSLRFTISAETSYPRLQRLMLILEKAPLLQRVQTLDVRIAKSPFEDLLEVGLDVQALILGDAEDRNWLLSDVQASELDNVLATGIKRKSSPFLVIKKREKPIADDLVEEIPKVEVAVTEPPKPDLTDRVIQIGTIFTGTVGEAWFIDRVTKEKSVLGEGDTFDFYGVNGLIERVERKAVVISIDGKRSRWRLAESLKDRVVISDEDRYQASHFK
ncbi:MAG: hypothetical protein P1U77_22940 [Rubripirellula sp.]|nr:hypothetical protein [Rubripirellula sp.]